MSEIIGPPLDRRFGEAQVEMRGPTFAKVWDTPGFGYSERFKHTIGPEVSWTYRTRVDDFYSIPKFDGNDYFLGTNQIAYSLVQRFFAKRRGPSGKLQPYEFLTWRLMQTYYVQIADGQSNFDPNYSSSAFGPGFKPEHLSPLMSRLKLSPTRSMSVDYQVEYDVNFEQFRRNSVYLNLAASRVALSGGWSRSVRLSENVDERTVGSHTLRGNTLDRALAPAPHAPGLRRLRRQERPPVSGAREAALLGPVLRLLARVHPLQLQRPRREAVALQPEPREHRLDGQLPGRGHGQRGRSL